MSFFADKLFQRRGDREEEDGRNRSRDQVDDRWGASGAGLVLVLLPSLALFFGASYLEEHGSIGLPVVAVFGIMVLVGALAMTSTLFRRLGLASRRQPLALPPGSVRATMAMALIVLFSIIAIAAMRPPQELKELRGMSGALLAELARDPRISVIKATLEDCASTPTPRAPERDSVISLSPPTEIPKTPCPIADERHTVLMKVGPDAGSQDLVKQLVLMIGQLMTMAVSFYFAGRNAGGVDETKSSTSKPGLNPDGTPRPGFNPDGTPKPGADAEVKPGSTKEDDTPVGGKTTSDTPVDDAAARPLPGSPNASVRVAAGPGPRSGTTFDLGGDGWQAAGGHDEHDGCGGVGDVQTKDEDLPEARGGIARP
jgi:hypothetical protein